MNYTIIIQTANDGVETAPELQKVIRSVAKLLEKVPICPITDFVKPVKIDLKTCTGSVMILPSTTGVNSLVLHWTLSRIFDDAKKEFEETEIYDEPRR